MATNTAGSSARQDPRNVLNTIEYTVNYNTSGVSSGVKIGTLPAGAVITNTLVEVITAFNASTANALVVGTNASSYNNIAASGDVDETVAGVYLPTRGFGRSIAANADIDVYVMYTQSGAAASAGQAKVVLAFTGGWTT